MTAACADRKRERPAVPLYKSVPKVTSWNTSASPSQSSPIQAAAGPRRTAYAANSSATRWASARKVRPEGAGPRNSGSCRRAVDVGGRPAATSEFVLILTTLTCQSISSRSRWAKRALARVRPSVDGILVRKPASSFSSWPSVAETKCGMFSVRSADLSARWTGQSGSSAASQSARRATKSACADHATPSSIVL